MRRNHLLTLLAVPVLMLAVACGCTTTETSGGGSDGGGTPSNAPTTVPVGQTMTLTETFIGNRTVMEITVANPRYAVKPTNQFDKSKHGQFVVADVTFLVKEGKASIYPGKFKLVGADGTAYDTSSLVGVTDISGNDITTGQKTAGAIVFDAAATVKAGSGAKIALTSLFSDGDVGYWTL